jgi:hypothetical protein
MNSSLNIVRVIKSRRMRLAGHVARMGGVEVYTGFWWGNLKEIEHLQDPGEDGRMDLKRVCDRKAWPELIRLGIGARSGHL